MRKHSATFILCLYFTNLALIFKIAERMNQPYHRSLRSRIPQKNVLCFSDLARGEFFLKKERVFSFEVLPSKYSGSVN